MPTSTLHLNNPVPSNGAVVSSLGGRHTVTVTLSGVGAISCVVQAWGSEQGTDARKIGAPVTVSGTTTVSQTLTFDADCKQFWLELVSLSPACKFNATVFNDGTTAMSGPLRVDGPISAPSFQAGSKAPRPLTGKESLAGTTGDFTIADLGAIGQRMTPLNSVQFTTAITGHTSHDSRTAWFCRKSTSCIWVVFRNWLPFNAGIMSIERDYIDANIDPITVSCSVEIAGTYYVNGRFADGSRSFALSPGGEVMAKIVGPFNAGSTYFIRTHVDCNASKYVPAYPTLSPNTGYLFDSASIVRSTGTSGYTINASTPVYGPSALYTDIPELGILAWGDSIMAAVGETGSDQRYGQYVQGWLRRWANGVVGVDALGLSGATLNTLSNTWGYCESTLMALLTKRGSAAIVAFGANDCLSKTFSQITTAYQTFIGNLRANGVQKIWVPTILPRTTSTDGWVTEANQTPATGFEAGGVRDQTNTWFWSQEGVLIDKVLDVNKNVEATSKNKWKANQTNDGAHPNSTAVQNMVAGLPSIASII